MNKTELAKRINVTRQTLTNWEKSKPELIRLIEMGLESDNLYLKFFDLFPKNGELFLLHDFYIDFYFRFLNYYRQNITKLAMNLNYTKKDIFSSAIIYFIKNNKDTLFSSGTYVTDVDLTKFVIPEFKKPISIDDKDLSEYILRNVLDDFETLLKDVKLKVEDDRLFYIAIRIAVTYLIYKFEPSLTISKKNKRYMEILVNKLEFDKLTIERTSSWEEVYKKYIQFRLEYTQKHILKIENELPYYQNNDFYVPNFLNQIVKQET